MSLPRWWAEANRVVLNPIVHRIAWWAPGMGVIVHRGRRSGREYRTSVLLFRTGDRFVVALPYGTAADWVRNVQAARGASLHTRRRQVPIRDPRTVEDAAHPGLPRLFRRVFAVLGLHDFLEFTG